ncbi:MAG: hypothetical protein DMG62_24655 [Acidobacteria bacterium]|nr:MAG: hypothetical protein DMG62_24655 [Acidobacteriota bacterium]
MIFIRRRRNCLSSYGDPRTKASLTTVSQLADHYRQRELQPDTLWKTHSTKVTYEGYLNK